MNSHREGVDSVETSKGRPGVSPANPDIDFDEYYKFLRDEIVREDGIASSRITSALTFNGFLMAALGVMISGAWLTEMSDCVSTGVVILREHALILIGFVGMAVALMACRGIGASFAALEVVKNEWNALLKGCTDKKNLIVPDPKQADSWLYIKFPRTFGSRGLEMSYGLFLPIAFFAFWTIYTILALILLQAPWFFHGIDLEYKSCTPSFAGAPAVQTEPATDTIAKLDTELLRPIGRGELGSGPVKLLAGARIV